jgi:two-component system, chemotaxis family, sensor kinase CheA
VNASPANPLLEQFLSEAHDLLESIGKKLLQLEEAPDDQGILNELFRSVHTLKGNSGLFTWPEMTRVLHAGEDLLGMVRSGNASYSRELADRLLEAMDFVDVLCREIKSMECIDAARAAESERMTEGLRKLMPSKAATGNAALSGVTIAAAELPSENVFWENLSLGSVPEAARMAAFRQCREGETLFWIDYRPERECFFHGDDPLNTARHCPGLLWGRVFAPDPLPTLTDLDTYSCVVKFQLLTAASREELAEYYRYLPDQVEISAVAPLLLVIPQGSREVPTAEKHFCAEALRMLEAADFASLRQFVQAMLEGGPAESWLTSALRWLLCLLEDPEWLEHNACNMAPLIESLETFIVPDWTHPRAVTVAPAESSAAPADGLASAGPQPLSEDDRAAWDRILAAQRQILALEDRPAWHSGRLRAVATVLTHLHQSAGDPSSGNEIQAALAEALSTGRNAPLLAWLDARENLRLATVIPGLPPVNERSGARPATPAANLATALEENSGKAPQDDGVKFGRRAEDAVNAPRVLKVDQAKVDRLMNLIGELVVSKNALPYLAERAESQFGVREIAREIKGQYSVINRIADEMQDAIMQVRMMAVSFIFQRFPRMVRDISRKLGKEVQLVLEGEQTEADKNIIESLADPLIHIVRNSLDHGIETPEVRIAAGKPAAGKLIIRATQEGDRVVIEIIDDGKGIDPAVIKRKAYEKGLIDEAALQRMGDQEAINLIFAAGLSTAAVVSDLSGRGVGMDVVRSAVEKINGTVLLDSQLGKGTTIRISLPLSMAVTQVMIIESDQQLFGVPMDHVVETVRVPVSAIRTIKQSQTALLRGRIVPLKSLNTLLGIRAIPKTNSDDELAVLLVQAGSAELGLLIDGFRETMGVIQKPLNGLLSSLSTFSGSALMGDGSVLMILNIREIV